MGDEGWQPIETAPKDVMSGQSILIYSPMLGMHVVEWGGDCWQTLDGSTYLDRAFTHWRPLPSPPPDTVKGD